MLLESLDKGAAFEGDVVCVTILGGVDILRSCNPNFRIRQ